MTTIKLIGTKRFELELLQNDTTGEFIVRYEDYREQVLNTSEPISDFFFASYMFDLKLMDLEGT